MLKTSEGRPWFMYCLLMGEDDHYFDFTTPTKCVCGEIDTLEKYYAWYSKVIRVDLTDEANNTP